MHTEGHAEDAMSNISRAFEGCDVKDDWRVAVGAAQAQALLAIAGALQDLASAIREAK